MYFITNANGELIAADEKILTLCTVDNFQELYKKVLNGKLDIMFSDEEGKVTIEGETIKSQLYSFERAPLDSILGDLYIIHLSLMEEEVDSLLSLSDSSTREQTKSESAEISSIAQEKTVAPEESDFFQNNFILDKLEKAIEEKDESSSAEEHVPETDFDVLSDIIPSEKESLAETLAGEEESEKTEMRPVEDESSFSLEKDTEASAENLNLLQTKEIKEEMFDELLLPDQADNVITSIPSESSDLKKEPFEENIPIIIPITQISQKIGISVEDYQVFLDEYIDTALALEHDLKSTVKAQKNSAIKTLMHLSNILQLPKIDEIMDELAQDKNLENENTINRFYNILAHLTIVHDSTENDSTNKSNTLSVPENQVSEIVEDVNDDEILELFSQEIDIQEETQEKLPEEPSDNELSGNEISLNDVTPVHFDFQLEYAADELSLPVELIEEFVFDFIEQARTETPKILKAYEKKDLDTIQKIGHMLKGAASNLRITPLADTLYEIQFCPDIESMEPLIKNYWAHFLSFENQMKLISKERN